MDVPIEPFEISHGRIMDVFDESIVRIETDEGIEGWGDSVPWGANFVAAFAKGVRAGIEELAPHLIGRDPRMVGQINEIMDYEMTGQPSVKSAIDVACWDILGRATGQPLYMLLGGKLTPDLPIYGSLPPKLGPALEDKIEDLRAKGFKRFSSKSSGDVATDAAYLRRVGELLDAGESLKYDANGGWQVQQAIRIINQMGNVDVMFEQPCASYEDCRIIRDVCAELNVPLEIQDCSWSQLACAAIAHMGHSTPGRVMMSALAPMGMKMMNVHNPVSVGDRFMRAPELPGLGSTPQLDILGCPIAVFE